MKRHPQSQKAGSLKALLFLYAKNPQFQVYFGVFAFFFSAMIIWSAMDLGSLITDRSNLSMQMVKKIKASDSTEFTSLSSHQDQIELNTFADLMSTLNNTKLFNSHGNHEYADLVVHKFPDSLRHLDVPNKKQTFFRTLLPSIIVALLILGLFICRRFLALTSKQ